MTHFTEIASMFTPVVAVRRYDSAGDYTTETCRARFKRFSSDSKRKTAAYDRIGYSVSPSNLRTGETTLLDGDVIVNNEWPGGEQMFLVGKQVGNQAHVPGMQGIAASVFEALYCNARVNVVDPGNDEDPLTGELLASPVAKFSNIPASLISAEYYETEPYSEVKDSLLITFPGVLPINEGFVIKVLAFPDTDNLLEHTYYRVEYPVVDSIGVKKYRLIKDTSGYGG